MPTHVEISEEMKDFFDTKILLCVDAIIATFDGIVLIKRKYDPQGWALPGGKVEYGETVEEAVVREVKEETGLDFQNFEQFHVYSEPDRDPRKHVISVVFIGEAVGIPVGADDADEAKIFHKTQLPTTIVFDHRDIIDDYFNNKYGRM